MYPSGYTQDTSQYIRIRILITNPPKLDNKPPLTPLNPTELRLGFILSYNNNWADGRTIKRTIDGARDPRPTATLIVVLDEPEPDMDFDSMDASNRRYFDSLDASKQRAS